MPWSGEHRVRFEEIDAAGVVFFAQFFTIAHQTWERALLSVGVDLAAWLHAGQHGLPLVHAESDYRHFLRYGDTASITVTVAAIGTSSVTVRYQFRLGATDLANLTLIHACVDLTTKRAAPFPAELRTALERLT
jgi:YbgC/YbaW family acyl-CoA thioester hydrolase